MSLLPTRIDGPVAVIGDVHGQTDKLRRVIDKLSRVPDIHRRWIVFIGDLVDRGPDSKGALDIFCELTERHGRVAWVCGNHELAMAGSLKLIDVPDFIDWSGRWLPHYDSDCTFQSYGVPHGELAALREALPEKHAQLLSDLPWSVEHPQFLFVHAGLDPDLPFEMQIRILRQRDYTLANPPWMYSKTFIRGPLPSDCPVTVVLGHVPIPQVTFNSGIIATDTTGGVTGELSCVLLPEGVVLTSGQDQPHQPQIASTPRRPKSSWWKVW
jgi:serine/threonine protein phosphatase 1